MADLTRRVFRATRDRGGAASWAFGPVQTGNPSGTLPVTRATYGYGRLVRTYDQLLAKLDELPQRQLSTRIYMAYQRRAPLADPASTGAPGTGDAALYLGISPKTLTLTVDRRAFAQRG